MSDTLDGMTVAQLDELIARAQATKEKVEEKQWVDMPPSREGNEMRVNRKTLEVHYLSHYEVWFILPMQSEVVKYVCQKVWNKSDMTNVANALLALANHTK